MLTLVILSQTHNLPAPADIDTPQTVKSLKENECSPFKPSAEKKIEGKPGERCMQNRGGQRPRNEKNKNRKRVIYENNQ